MTNPQDRYVTLNTKVLANGKTVYSSTRPVPTNVNPNASVTIVAGATDRMDILAYNAYGSPFDWWRIAAANQIVNGNIFIKPGTTTIIPSK